MSIQISSFYPLPELLVQFWCPSCDVNSCNTRVSLHQLNTSLCCLSVHHLRPGAAEQWHSGAWAGLTRQIIIPFGRALDMAMVARLVAEQADVQLEGLSCSAYKRGDPTLLKGIHEGSDTMLDSAVDGRVKFPPDAADPPSLKPIVIYDVPCKWRRTTAF